MKNSVKGMNRDGKGFKYLGQVFPKLSDGVLKEGIPIGLQINKLFDDVDFIKKITAQEFKACN